VARVSRFLEVRGARLALEERGEGEPFVWCHGLTSSRDHEDEVGWFDWSGLCPGVRLVRYDARAHGESSATPEPEDYGWERLAEDLRGVADALGLERFVLGGASMGAATALHFAVRARERLRGLLLVIPPTAWETRRAQAGIYRGAAALIERSGVDAFLEASAKLPPPAIFAEEPDPYRFRPAIAESALPTVLRGAAVSDLPGPDAIGALRLPTLVLAWDTDPGHPVSTALALAGLIEGAELEVARSTAEIRAWPERVRRFLERLP
jgi:pimeloyl-ACP methyl ester carboxylesterase